MASPPTNQVSAAQGALLLALNANREWQSSLVPDTTLSKRRLSRQKVTASKKHTSHSTRLRAMKLPDLRVIDGVCHLLQRISQELGLGYPDFLSPGNRLTWQPSPHFAAGEVAPSNKLFGPSLEPNGRDQHVSGLSAGCGHTGSCGTCWCTQARWGTSRNPPLLGITQTLAERFSHMAR